MSNSSIAIELPCYTIINIPQDQEQPTEQKLKEDLERGDIKVNLILHLSLSYNFNKCSNPVHSNFKPRSKQML